MPRAETAPETVALVTRVCAFLREQPDEPPTLAVLGDRVGLSPAHLQRVFKRVVGVSPRQYADSCRLARLKTGLKAGDSVTTALFAAGYGSSSRLYEKAGAQLGMTPGEYQKGGAHATIRYSIARCPLGRVILAMTERGVCGVALGGTDAELEEFVRTEFPAAKLTRDDKSLAEWVGELLQELAGKAHRDLPLDVRATAFQRRVWEELRKIPRGETRTYQQVAEAIGAPTAARAVARACATNPASLVIPCHRVVGTDGKLRGYRWGLQRKQKLLETERGSSAEE